MMGYVPQILPQSYVQVKSPFNGIGGLSMGNFGLTAPPLVQADNSSAGSSGGLLNLVGGLVGSVFGAGAKGSQEFNAEVAQFDAAQLADDRSRRWAAFGAVAVGIAGVVGLVYLLRK